METVGLTAEYNPFHNGHRAQLEAVRRRFGRRAGVLVCLSGPWTQRGVPAFLDKRVRAELAIEMGADLVIELPQAFAAASAERFARGAVDTMIGTGIIRHLVYGTDDADAIDRIRALAAHLADESDALSHALRERIAEGHGFANARERAVRDLYGDAMGDLLTRPDTILAVEYEKALITDDPEHRITTHALPLVAPERHSATALRARLERGVRSGDLTALIEDLGRAMPAPAAARWIAAVTRGDGFVTEEMTARYILSAPALYDVERLRTIDGMDGGLAERVVRMLRDDPTAILSSGKDRPFDRWVRTVASRSHPASRVRRALLAAAFDRRAADPALTSAPPAMIRVLAFNRQGQHMLALMRRHAHLPVVQNASDMRALAGDAKRQAMFDHAVQTVWNVHADRRPKSEFEHTLRPM
jgi:predicted nucleotidyltransferase